MTPGPVLQDDAMSVEGVDGRAGSRAPMAWGMFAMFMDLGGNQFGLTAQELA